MGNFWREWDPWNRVDDVLRTMYIMMNAPEDWDARGADAKFRAAAGTASPMQWHRGQDIMDAQDPARLAQTVRQLAQAHAGLRWRRADELNELPYSLPGNVGAGIRRAPPQ